MIIRALKTPRVTVKSHKIEEIIDASVQTLKEKSILAVTSKIISLCEGRAVKIDGSDKVELVKKESEYYIPPEQNPHAITLTLTNNLLVPTAGIDESNGDGYYVLWPQDAQQSAQSIRTYIANKFRLHDIGVLITDSRTTPMRWGVTGIALAYAGFSGLNDFIGLPDLFGRPMHYTKVNVADGLAAAAVVTMGESNEQTPLAVITEADFVKFDAGKPTSAELKEWHIPMAEDLYGPILSNAPWKKGKQDKSGIEDSNL